jgi:hypothetical protein
MASNPMKYRHLGRTGLLVSELYVVEHGMKGLLSFTKVTRV